jgi:prepilin-type N-terminal cleavage/methylation domain-containing protein
MHRGYTLIEMLVVLTVGSVITGVCVGSLHLLLRTERKGRDRVPEARVVAALAEQFRNDVHAAIRQISSTQKNEWQFALADDRVVTYRVLPGEVRWSERAAGKVARQESYVLPSDCFAVIATEKQTSPIVISLVIRSDGAVSTAEREMFIVAVLGKDHRYAKSPSGGQ